MSLIPSSHPDRQKWNTKYLQRSSKVSSVEPYIQQHITQFKKGTLLDFACGDGRNALYLAANGFEVTGVDISDEGLKRLEKFATEQHTPIQTIQLDLSNSNQLEKLGTYDNALICRYKPTPEILALIPKLLKPNGILMIFSFNALHAKRGNFSEKFCFKHEELLNIWPNMELVRYDKNVQGYSDGYIFRLKDMK